MARYDDIHIMFETMQTIYLAWPLQIELCPDFISLLLSKSEVTNSDCPLVEMFAEIFAPSLSCCLCDRLCCVEAEHLVNQTLYFDFLML